MGNQFKEAHFFLSFAEILINRNKIIIGDSNIPLPKETHKLFTIQLNQNNLNNILQTLLLKITSFMLGTNSRRFFFLTNNILKQVVVARKIE